MYKQVDRERAESRYLDNKEVYKLYPDNTEALVESEEDLKERDVAFGYEIAEKEAK